MMDLRHGLPTRYNEAWRPSGRLNRRTGTSPATYTRRLATRFDSVAQAVMRKPGRRSLARSTSTPSGGSGGTTLAYSTNGAAGSTTGTPPTSKHACAWVRNDRSFGISPSARPRSARLRQPSKLETDRGASESRSVARHAVRRRASTPTATGAVTPVGDGRNLATPGQHGGLRAGVDRAAQSMPRRRAVADVSRCAD